MTLLFFSFLCLLCSHATPAAPSPGRTVADELALLSFKSVLSAGLSDSEGLLASWNTSSHHCSWPGVVCGGHRDLERVVALSLGSSNLSGPISPSLGNLSFLRVLDLGDNRLVGEIPPELGRLSKLRLLNLTANSLHGSIPVAIGVCTNLTTLVLSENQLQGTIPLDIGTKLKNLAYLDFRSNGLSGEIPRSLAELSAIQFLDLSYNRLSGEIPPALGNLTHLRHLVLANNSLSGAIPSSLGQLPSLSRLGVASNNLTGVIPTSIWNISSLTVFSVQSNMLGGMIPSNAFSALPLLQGIFVSRNQFHGFFPVSIVNASSVSRIQLGHNFFSGVVPPEIGRLRNLNRLLLFNNLFEAKEPEGWEFISALTNCTQLRRLGLTANKFGGVLPDSLSNLSTSLEHLDLSSNTITGNIPKDIGNLIGLLHLSLSKNSFTGSLPSSLGRLKNLGRLHVFQNNISGPIPLAIGNLTELNYLRLSMNAFSGRIPSTLVNLTKLLLLDLSTNNFTGRIPSGLFNIQTLSIFFNVSHNNLEGSIPQEIGNLKNLVEFRAESNKLSGEIPSALGECQLLQNLYLQNNFLNGSIPPSLSNLKSLETLDLSSNNLSGQIPKFLGSISMLHSLNFSFNSFVGEVPIVGAFANASEISIQGNGELCGGIPDLHLLACYSQLQNQIHKSLVVTIVISLTATLAILSSLYMLLTWHKKSKTKIPSATSTQGHPIISYSQLVKATDGFSTTNLLGSGSFGSVYKGELDGQDGKSKDLVAVKVLKLQTPKALKSFTAECEALRNMRHRNLVKIITVCSSIDTRGNDFKAIVYDFMLNGSLEGWLHPDTNDQAEEKHLNLYQRVTILLDVACALDYLHCHGPAPVVHCDLKSGNVLLDAKMVAHVGDFGLAKILVEESSSFLKSTSSMGFRGTIGYAAPEYGAGNMASTNGDVYSYGILVLETVTGKRPMDSRFRQGLSLRECVERALRHHAMMDVVDARLCLDLENELQTMDDSSSKRKIDGLTSLLRLGMSCSQEMPSSRMSTGDIIKELHAIKESLW